MDPESRLAGERSSERAARRFILLLLGSVPLVYFAVTALSLDHLTLPVVVAGLAAVLGPYVAALNVWGMSTDARVEFGMLCTVLFVQAVLLGGALSAVFGLPTVAAFRNPLVRFFTAILLTSFGAVLTVVVTHGALVVRTVVRPPPDDDDVIDEVLDDSD